MHFRFKLASALTLVLLFGASVNAFGQRSARTLSRGVDELASEAELIVRGSIVSAKVEPHPELNNLKTVVVSLRVDETWKGVAGKTLQFRQYIWDIRDELDSARYQKGEAILLFLGPTSQYGLRSPAGLEQGRFHLTRDKAGRWTATNGRGNAGLFAGTYQRTKSKGVQFSARSFDVIQRGSGKTIAVDELKAVVRDLVRSKK